MSIQPTALSRIPSIPAPLRPEPTGAFELVMRDSPRLNEALLDERNLSTWLTKFLGISVLGLGVHGVAVGLVAQLGLRSGALSAFDWLQGNPLVWMPLSVVGAMLGALAICLPSFYFYTQLAGLDASFRLITAEALRVQARTSVLLLAALPFYVALGLGSLVVRSIDAQLVLVVGLVFPFLVGLAGIHSLHKAFEELVEILPTTHLRRGDFLMRLVLCWGAVYSAVAPVALYRLGQGLGASF